MHKKEKGVIGKNTDSAFKKIYKCYDSQTINKVVTGKF